MNIASTIFLSQFVCLVSGWWFDTPCFPLVKLLGCHESLAAVSEACDFPAKVFLRVLQQRGSL
jgi:hypothetical protein